MDYIYDLLGIDQFVVCYILCVHPYILQSCVRITRHQKHGKGRKRRQEERGENTKHVELL